MRVVLLTVPAILILAGVIARGIIQDRHPFFLFVAAVAGSGCSYCIARSLATGATPGNYKIAPCDRLPEPFGYWFNVAGWTLCYFLMLWLAWNIPPLRSS
ncbi:hypothetical protein TSACC_21302 [Terrimicrobium sacchariphilum]|uniref:Uncharacterized protein n=1 Tax=Terrimicrobium sacchariphilum TaxID=690879 RepID=A0A146G5M1_TERSA|nr:hypothetical protein [Terrimicrobium sacchariphilum]GAT32900.1 hypothetical protein TSACC_21302 [Terrimicrobium sacchariphilum]